MYTIYNNNETFADIADGMLDYLKSIGHTNCIITDTINNQNNQIYIIFGLNNFNVYQKLPEKYIAIQLEQSGILVSDNTSNWFTPLYFELLNKAIEVWDYSLTNIQNLKRKINVPMKYVPLLYMKHLAQENNLTTPKDIDIVFIGSLNDRRQNILNQFEEAGLKVYIAKDYNVWGQERANLLKRTKIVLNIHYYQEAILETARLSYVLSTSECIVVSERSKDKLLDRLNTNYVTFGNNVNELITKCKEILELDNSQIISRINTTCMMYRINKFVLPISEKKEKKEKKEKEKEKEKEQGFFKPEFDNTNGTLKLDKFSYNDLPYVSIVTITRNRKQLFEIPIANFQNFEYPKDKLEWIIVDDGNDNLSEVIPKDNRIKYIRYEYYNIGLPISKKRDIGVQNASYDYIVFMDDDDYYFPISVYSRIAAMKTYSKDCIGCTSCGIYDVHNDKSFIMNTKHIFEASMAFTKRFWKQRNFGDKDHEMGEGMLFLSGRENEVIDMPYFFNIIAITHNNNVTKKLRTIEDKTNNNYDNFFSMWDLDTQMLFLDLIKKNKFN